MSLLNRERLVVVLEKVQDLEEKILTRKQDLEMLVESYGIGIANDEGYIKCQDECDELQEKLNNYYDSLEGVDLDTIKEVLSKRSEKNRVAFNHYWQLLNDIEGEPEWSSEEQI